ncbi:MAG: hypothetical protein FJ026_11150, partial [Chloroflexi bacterium]|nr:hypothetical protein [Chloroflexota bacterium]
MFKKVALAVVLVIIRLALAALYLGGVAALSNRVARLLRPEPRLAAPATAAGQDWPLFAETAHFRYHVRPGDHIPRWALDLAEDHLQAACTALWIQFPGQIEYYKHPSQADLEEATGSASTGVVLTAGQQQELHSVSSYDPHEVMHALAHTTMGEPPAFFDEGLATAFGWDWTPGEQGVHTRARLLLEEGRLVPLQRLLANWDFRSYKSYPAYTTAGSFIKYLLAERGPEKLSQLFHLDRYSQRDEIEGCFVSVYGQSIYEMESAWRLALEQGALAATPHPAAAGSNRLLVFMGIVLFIF